MSITTHYNYKLGHSKDIVLETKDSLVVLSVLFEFLAVIFSVSSHQVPWSLINFFFSKWWFFCHAVISLLGLLLPVSTRWVQDDITFLFHILFLDLFFFMTSATREARKLSFLIASSSFELDPVFRLHIWAWLLQSEDKHIQAFSWTIFELVTFLLSVGCCLDSSPSSELIRLSSTVILLPLKSQSQALLLLDTHSVKFFYFSNFSCLDQVLLRIG